MRIEQCQWTEAGGWSPAKPGVLRESAQLVLAFGGTRLFKEGTLLGELSRAYPKAHLVGCSTAGEIQGVKVSDDTLVVTAVAFSKTRVVGRSVRLDEAGGDSSIAGERLAAALPPEGLAHVFVLSDGLAVNGTALVRGLTGRLPPDIKVTGGLSGDGSRFQETYVLSGSTRPQRGAVAVVGFYGESLRVGCASLGGWDSFGPERLVTKAEGSVLYELNGESALELYKKYLGDDARGLPSTGLLFPLSLRIEGEERGVVRTILAVDEEKQSMTFAGDMPEGSYAQLMKANFDRLIDGAVGAAKTSFASLDAGPPELAVLISCVGRKLILAQRIEEEVEGVAEIFGKKAALTGFYSYGEISPFTPGAKCELHNQTMTITTFAEV